MRKIFTLLLAVFFIALSSANNSGRIHIEAVTCPTATAMPTTQTFCSGQSTSIQLFSNVANTTFTWTAVQTGVTGATNGTGNIISQILNATTSNLGQVTYTITPFADSCFGTPITVIVSVHPIPTVTVNSPTVCSGSSTTVTATPGATGSYFYVWTVPAGVPNPGNVASFTTSVSGTYSVIATNAASGCASASTSGIVTVNPPAGTFNLQCGVPTPTQVYIDWSNITGITTFNYSYSINGGPIITGSQSAPSSIYITNNNQPVTFTLSGTGTVCAPTETVTCGTLNTNENSISNFVISPNPVIDLLNIKNDQTINKVNVFNQLGQVVLQKEYNTNEVQLDFSGLKTGIYFIAVDSDKKQSTFKIVKN